MIPMSTGMLFFLRRLLNCSLRVAFSLRMSGVRLGYSRVEGGFIMQFIDLSHTLCSLGGPSTTSNSRMLLLSKLPWSSEILEFYCSA